MKGLTAASAIALLSFMVINPRVNAQTLPEVNINPQIEKFQFESTEHPDLTENNKDAKIDLEQIIEQKEYQQVQADLDESIELDSSRMYAYLFREFQVIELPTVAYIPNKYIKS